MKKTIYISIILILFNSCGMGELVDSSKSNSYFKKGGNIYYSPNGNWFGLGYDKCNADTESFEVLSENIAKDKKSIFSGYKIQTHIDYSTFNVDVNNVPKDKNYVYEIGTLKDLRPVKIKDVDVKSFEYISKGRYSKYGWAKDKNHYYFKQRIVNIDYESLKFLTEDFFYDKDSLYTDLHNWKIKAIKPIIDIPKKLTKKYIIAEESIYYVGRDSSQKIELKTIEYKHDIGEVKTISNNVISINNKIVYYGEIFKEADADTFQPISDSELGTHMKYYKDKNNVYLDKKIINNANPKTFSKQKLGYSKDDKFVFYKTEILEGVDPKSFREDKNKFMEWVDNKGNRFDSNGKRIK